MVSLTGYRGFGTPNIGHAAKMALVSVNQWGQTHLETTRLSRNTQHLANIKWAATCVFPFSGTEWGMQLFKHCFKRIPELQLVVVNPPPK